MSRLTRDREISIFPVQLATSRIGNLTRLIHTLLYVMSILLYRRRHTRFGEGGGQLDRRRARGVLNPCVQESKARIGRFLREKLISDDGLFSSYEGRQGAANG